MLLTGLTVVEAISVCDKGITGAMMTAEQTGRFRRTAVGNISFKLVKLTSTYYERGQSY